MTTDRIPSPPAPRLLARLDRAYLDLDADARTLLWTEAERALGAVDPDSDAWAAQPSGLRLRAFCVRNGLVDELERLVRDETSGEPGGALVAGGRVYAVYPYLRGLPRRDADITAEVGVDHLLTAVTFRKGVLRVAGSARLHRVAARSTDVTLVLRADGTEHRVPCDPRDGGFRCDVDPADLADGDWDASVTVEALGLVREAPFGDVRDETCTLDATGRRSAPGGRFGTDREITARAAPSGHLTLDVHPATEPASLPARLLRRLRR